MYKDECGFKHNGLTPRQQRKLEELNQKTIIKEKNNMDRTFINFNGVLINTRYIKKIFKTDSNYKLPNKEFYYEIRINVDGTPGTHVETYKNEKDRNDRFFGLETLLTPNY